MQADTDNEVSLEKCSHLLGYIDQSGLINQGVVLCGEIGCEALCRIFLNSEKTEPIEKGDLREITSHDVDFRASEKTFDTLTDGYPLAQKESKEYLRPEIADELSLGRFLMQGPDKPIKVEVLDRLKHVDNGPVPPYQGITTIEKPLGEKGPRVKLLDPLSILMLKMHHVNDYMDNFDNELAPTDYRLHFLHKADRYRWHARKITLCIPAYLDVIAQRREQGEEIRDPAIISSRLLDDIQKHSESYCRIIGTKQMGIICAACQKHARGTTQTFYENTPTS